MEEDHLKNLLELLERYPQTEITLTLSNQQKIPYAIIKYEKKAFILFELDTETSSHFTDIWTLLTSLHRYWGHNNKLAGA
ncbi:hypothetical protein [Bacillus infantis]|uniref:hypothetical protein n=1 Tax=Bacillus infantis TaxID=324767 RepID=UPI002155D647|nr:hypothetical protein [Bacillus infantis]MCR6611192.1 hypothetical protein [Bacillus infantis]